MSRWPMVALHSVANIERKVVEANKISSGTPYIGLENIKSGGDLTDVKTVRTGDLASSKFSFTSRHLLYGKLRPYLAKIARPEFDGICSTDILPVLPGPDLDRSYLTHYLRQPNLVSFANSRATGANLPRLSATSLGEFLIPLPPLPEQRRIADILDKADALRTKRRAALAKLDTLSQSIFIDMFGDPATNPKGWPIRTVAELCKVMGGKRLPKGEDYSSRATPFRYIRVSDMKSGIVDESNLVYLKPEIQAKIARYVVNTGDVIISVAGSIGLIAPIPSSLNGVNLTENAAKLAPRSIGNYNARYLADWLRTPFAQNDIGSHVGLVTIGKLALFRIEKVRVLLPPLSLQNGYVDHIEEIDLLKSKQQSSLSEFDMLFASLQNRAFSQEY